MVCTQMLPGTTLQPDPNETPPPLPRPANARAVSPPPPPPIARPLGGSSRGGLSVGGARPKPSGSAKKKAHKKPLPPPPASKNGLPGPHVRTLKDCLMMLKKSDKNNVFQYPVPPNFRGLRGMYADVIKNPMDLGTVMKRIDSKYRTARDCIADVRLVFSNAKDFNPDTDPVHALAASLSGKFEAFVSGHRGVLGLDASAPTSSSGGSKSTITAPSIALPSSAGASAMGKRANVPQAAAATTAATAAAAVKEPAVAVLTAEEQEQLAKDVEELFRVGNANPLNEKAQARVYALYTFAKAYVLDKDRVTIDGGKGEQIKMDALNHVRQRQLRDIVTFFLADSVNDPPPTPSSTTAASSDLAASSTAADKSKDTDEGTRTRAGAVPPSRPGKRPRTDDVSDSENDDLGEQDEDDEDEDGLSPAKRSRTGSITSPGSKGATRDVSGGGDQKSKAEAPALPLGGGGDPFSRVDSSSLTLEATAHTLKASGNEHMKDSEIDIDLGEDEDDEDDEEQSAGGAAVGPGSGGEGGGSGDGSKTGKRDEQWLQAQAERKEREEREKARAETEKALEEQRLRQQAQREKERVEEGLRLSRERAAEKARIEAAALEKLNREKRELEEKKEAERLARQGTKASVDLDQVRADSNLMELMDESIYDD
ncbi:unnamed protein product [Ectocarpus sp. CCAP 1310/34]|nr:unnamed protein product [Ectocarpus sp. CCAP 1310/34]